MNRKQALGWILGVAMLAPIAAFAQEAYTNRTTNMRAGPNPQFPLVASIPAGAYVQVNGCVEGYSWCDVTAGPQRGWVYADYLSYPYRNQPVTVISAGPSLGFPIISFSVGNYWDSYYRGRPWYGNRAYWYGRPANWWYTPAPRYYQPVVRPWPYERHWNGNQWDSRPARYDSRGNHSPHYQANTPHYQANRPPQTQPQQPHYDNRVTKPRDPTTANIRDERRSDKPVTGERNQTSQSARTYSQQ
jgi:uncharacterized protein YraI